MNPEISKKWRDRTYAALMFACLAVGASCSPPDKITEVAAGLSDKSNSPNPIETINGLVRGDKIAESRILTPEAGIEREFTLRPKKDDQIEDLAIIYSPEVSQVLTSNSEEPNLSIGFLLTSLKGGLGMSLVLFDSSSWEVIGFDSNITEISEFGPIFSHTLKDGAGAFTVSIGPAEDGAGAIVRFDGVAPYDLDPTAE